jgi:hypothetical protein
MPTLYLIPANLLMTPSELKIGNPLSDSESSRRCPQGLPKTFGALNVR